MRGGKRSGRVRSATCGPGVRFDSFRLGSGFAVFPTLLPYFTFGTLEPIGMSLSVNGGIWFVDLKTAMGDLQMIPCGMPGHENSSSPAGLNHEEHPDRRDRKSTRLNSSH